MGFFKKKRPARWSKIFCGLIQPGTEEIKFCILTEEVKKISIQFPTLGTIRFIFSVQRTNADADVGSCLKFATLECNKINHRILLFVILMRQR